MKGFGAKGEPELSKPAREESWATNARRDLSDFKV